ncbi:acyl-CoA thioesterase [Francisellaceae bacterium]|nr:acyl-CoA thioesterase [Francisellaceae bacterium]
MMKKINSILSNTIEIEIPFYDVDAMNIVWHGNYIKYFEVARCALLDKIGYDYFQMKDSGYGWPIIDVRAKYIRPCKFKQKIQITAHLTEYENRLKIEYVISDTETGQKHTTGYSIQVAVNLNTEELCFASPNILIEKLKEYL